MKKSILPTLAGFACIIAFFLFSGLECNNEEDPKPDDPPPEPEKCGEKIVDRKWFESFNAEDLKQRCTFNQENGVSTFSFSAPSQENICPHEHLNITLEIIFFKSIEINRFASSADIMYGIFFNYPVQKENWKYSSDANYQYLKANVNFGIKGSFGDDPGWYRTFLDIFIIGTNGCEDGAKYFIDNVYMIKIGWEHYKYKEPEGK